ncbi:MAG TPA: hypothetical protein VL737_00495, partial [Candidatus Pristimantibacillus sp.]|nr:hypothetical protein [Candidatus Pristimantibacillus sp.]
MSVEAPTFDPATDPATHAAAGVPRQAGAPTAETTPMSYDEAMARSAAYLESLGFDSTLPANRTEADYESRHLEHEHQQARQERDAADQALDLHNERQELHRARIGTEDEALFSDPITDHALREERIGRDAEERFRAENPLLAHRNENDPFDKVVGVAFDNASKRVGREAVDSHRAEIDAEVKRMRAEKAAEAERQRIEEESYKARQERDQLFFDGERADDWDKKVQALDAAIEYSLAHEDDPRSQEDFATFYGRLRAGEKKAYDAYREKIENPAPEAPEPVTPPTPDQPQPGRRRTAERTQDPDRMTDAEYRELYQRKPRLGEVREGRGWRNRVPKLARSLGKLAGEKLRMWNKAELPEEDLDSLDSGEFITGPNADPEAAAHYRINGNGDYVAPERSPRMSAKNWAKHVIGLLTPQGPQESDRDYGRRISDIYKQDRAGWRARSREVGGEFDANHVATLFTNDLLAVERLDRQHVGQAQHRVWTTENLLGGLVEDFQLTPVEAGAAIARLVN